MPWVRLDDKFWRNAKMRLLSHAARGVHVDAMSYCADTPDPTGFLTFEEAGARATGPLRRRLIAELVDVVAWEPVVGGYFIHDFDKYLDKGSKERCRRWRAAKLASDAGETSPKRHGDVTVTSPRATGYSDNKNVRVLPGPEPGPGPEAENGENTPTKRRFELPQRGYKGGEMTALSEHLPKLAGVRP